MRQRHERKKERKNKKLTICFSDILFVFL